MSPITSLPSLFCGSGQASGCYRHFLSSVQGSYCYFSLTALGLVLVPQSLGRLMVSIATTAGETSLSGACR